MKAPRTLFALAMSVTAVAAYADVPPPPGSLSTYTVQLGTDLSKTLVSSISFQTVQNVELPRVGVWGPCTAQQMTWDSGTDSGMDKRHISCMDRDSCFYKAVPACTVTFVGPKSQHEQDMLKILSATPFRP